MTTSNELPYYAVIFTSLLHLPDEEYHGLDEKLILEAKKMDGFIGMDSARSLLGISVSYWKTLEDIQIWSQNTQHIFAKEKGKKLWYESYNVKICKIEKEYSFKR